MTDWWSSSIEVGIPAGRVARGRLRVPSSKSLTHRAFTLALVAARPVTVVDPLVADDTELTLGALAAYGFRVSRPAAGRVEIAPPTVWPDAVELACGNAGTLFRFVVAAASVLPVGRTRVDGVARLRERPIAPLVVALRDLGAEIDYLDRDGFAPLEVAGRSLIGGDTELDAGESSQYLSALLFAACRAERPVEIEVSRLASAPYVDLTLDLLAAHAGRVARPSPTRFRVEPAALTGGEIAIEADLSAAAYPAAAAALTGGEVELVGVGLGSRQGDVALLRLLAAMGARVESSPLGVSVRGDRLEAVEADLSTYPDQVPTLAALAPFARGTTRIRNVAHLRLKESDRLAAITSELRRTGAEVEELADGLVVPGVWADAPPPTDPVRIDSHGDHRIAMALALVGLRRPGLVIAAPHVVGKSYPGFFRDLAVLLGERA